jgi:hypothetical protein
MKLSMKLFMERLMKPQETDHETVHETPDETVHETPDETPRNGSGIRPGKRRNTKKRQETVNENPRNGQ